MVEAAQDEEVKGSQEEFDEDAGEEMDDGEQHESDEGSGADDFVNNHDLIGVKGIIEAQKNEIEKKKLELRIQNEMYFRQHPELSGCMALFIRQILDDRPDDILKYAGTFFDRAELRAVVYEAIEREKENDQRNQYLKDLISGKTLIE